MTHRWIDAARSAVRLVPFLFVLAACAGSADGPNEAGSLYLDAKEIKFLIDDAPAEQRKAVEDGAVSTAERERAYLAFLHCMEDQGLRTSSYELHEHGGDSFEQQVGTLTGADVDRITQACRQTHYRVVGAVYEFGHRRTEAEERAHVRTIRECMRGRGNDVPDDADLNEMSSIDRGSASACIAANR